MSDKLQFQDGKVIAEYPLIKRLVKKSGLRSKKIRKIMKRFKILVIIAIHNYVDRLEFK